MAWTAPSLAPIIRCAFMVVGASALELTCSLADRSGDPQANFRHSLGRCDEAAGIHCGSVLESMKRLADWSSCTASNNRNERREQK